MNVISKFKETVTSVLPVMAIVLVLGLTVAPIGSALIIQFVAGGVLLIAGLTIFLVGVDIGIQPIGERIGAALTSKRNLFLLLSISFVIGFFVTVAEPDIQVFGDQIHSIFNAVNKMHLVYMIASGVGLFIMIGLSADRSETSAEDCPCFLLHSSVRTFVFFSVKFLGNCV